MAAALAATAVAGPGMPALTAAELAGTAVAGPGSASISLPSPDLDPSSPLIGDPPLQLVPEASPAAVAASPSLAATSAAGPLSSEPAVAPAPCLSKDPDNGTEKGKPRDLEWRDHDPARPTYH